jgi:hypothetical protein
MSATYASITGASTVNLRQDNFPMVRPMHDHDLQHHQAGRLPNSQTSPCFHCLTLLLTTHANLLMATSALHYINLSLNPRCADDRRPPMVTEQQQPDR